MNTSEWTKREQQELHEARRELAAAERELTANTEAARTRYARALHEADLAERRADRQARETRYQGRHVPAWRLAAV